MFPCEGDQYFTHTENCNTWDKYNCPSKCDLGYSCMEFAACEDISTEEDPVVHCVCQLGKIFDETGTTCVDPPPPTPTERYIILHLRLERDHIFICKNQLQTYSNYGRSCQGGD